MIRTSVMLAAFVAMTASAFASPAYIDQIGDNYTVNPSMMATTSMDMLEPIMSSVEMINTSLGSVEVPVGGLALISQVGEGNIANIEQSGSYNLGIIQQIGFDNSAMLYQSGNNHRAMIYQNGNNNTAIVRQR